MITPCSITTGPAKKVCPHQYLMCHTWQQLKAHPLMCYTERSHPQNPPRPLLAGGTPSQPHIGVSGVRVSANTQRIFTHAGEQAGKIKCLWQLHMALSFPSTTSWKAGSIPLQLQAAGRAKATSSHPKSWRRAKTQLWPIPTCAMAPLSRGNKRSPLSTATPAALCVAASQASQAWAVFCHTHLWAWQ